MFGNCAWARYSLDTNVITLFFFHIPTLRIRAGCQCSRRTWSWPCSRELKWSPGPHLFFRSETKYCFVSSATLLFQWRLTDRNWANMGETEHICTRWYRVPRENDLRERIPHTLPSSHENYFQSILGSVSYCVVILRTPSYWSVRVASLNFKLGG